MKPFLTISLILYALNNGLFGQTLTPEQRARLDSLPPSLRAQAMEELERLRTAQQAATAVNQTVETPVVVTPNPPVGSPEGQDLESDFESEAGLTEEETLEDGTDEELDQFGYDLFAGTPTTFAPATEIPVPANYIIGPGDQIRIQFFGKVSASYDLYVSRDGILQVPDLGPIAVAGQLFTEVKDEISQRVAEQMIGVQAFMSLGELRSIRVFILGDVNRPGSYTVSALSTMTNALFVSGGIKPIGSLRNIQLKRSGETVAALDLYDLLLRGDTSNDARILPGDVIFVPPVGPLVGISGEVNRPAIYEIKEETSIADIVDIAGGYTAKAFPSLSQIERITNSGIKEILDLDLTQSEDGSMSLANGDIVRIYSSLDRTENIVRLEGMVERPGVYEWHEGMHLTDVLETLDATLPAADLDYIVIERKIEHTGRIEVLSSNLILAIENPGGVKDPALQAKDRILVMNDDRVRYRDELTTIIEKLRNQANFEHPAQVVEIRGSVRHPGEYPLESGMGIADLIRAAGEFTQDAYRFYSIIEKRHPITGRISVISADLRKALEIPSSLENRILEPNDIVYVLNDESDDYQNQIQAIVDRLRSQANSEEPESIVQISGYVRHPGEYPLEKGMNVSDLIRAAGGFSQEAYTLEGELLRYSHENQNERTTTILPIYLLDLNQNTAGYALESFDQVLIKRIPEWTERSNITLNGEIRFPGIYTIERGETLSDVIQRAGGLTALAFPKAAVFTRESLRQRETEQLERLRARLREDVSTAKIQQDLLSSDSVATAEELLGQLEGTQPLGRLVINLPKIIAGNSDSPVFLRDGDTLIVPQEPQSVSVIGSVNYPTSHFYDSRYGRNDYIDLSGGLLKRADRNRVYVVKANGQVNVQSRSRFFPGKGQQISAGDTIVVPVDIDRMRPLEYWGQVSQIIFQMALGVAAVDSFSD